MRKNELFEAITQRDISRIQRILDSKPSFGWFEFGLNHALKHVFEDEKRPIPDKIVEILLKSKADPNIPLTFKNPAYDDNWRLKDPPMTDLGWDPWYITRRPLEHAFYIENANLIHILLDANARVEIVYCLGGLFPISSRGILPSKVLNLGPLVAWRMLVAAAWPRSIIMEAISYSYFVSDTDKFIFLRALSSLWISQKRHSAMIAMLCNIMPKVLAELVVAYSNEQEKKPKDIECEIASTPVWYRADSRSDKYFDLMK